MPSLVIVHVVDDNVKKRIVRYGIDVDITVM